jgi:tetratricopeptide (TPR) repeat protein
MPPAKLPARGKIEEQSLQSVLQALLREKRDGLLTVSRGAITRQLYLSGGMITCATSNQTGDRLGDILVLQGKLTKADHKRYWAESQGANRLLGITLLVNGRITLNDLYQAVTAQVVTILDRLQKWRTGEWEFEAGRAPAAGTVLLRIPLALYLKEDAEKKPAKKAAAKPRGRGKAAAPPPEEAAAPEPAPEPVPAADEEHELTVFDDEAGATDGEPAAPAAAAPASVPASAPAPAPAPVPEPEPEPELDDERLGELSFMVQELRKRVGQEPHLLLGVAAGADRATIQEQYHRIAKVLHPDLVPKGCPPELALEAADIFGEVTAASTAMEDASRRQGAEKPAAPQAAARPVSDEELARRFFMQGRDWIAKRNYWQAADALRQAVRVKPDDPVYRQYLGLALMQTKRMHEAEEHLVEAARLEPHNPSHYVNLGRIYRSGRLIKKAREAFERALRIEPRNTHAREELADLPPEPASARKPEGGLLKKLFGKG